MLDPTFVRVSGFVDFVCHHFDYWTSFTRHISIACLFVQILFYSIANLRALKHSSLSGGEFSFYLGYLPSQRLVALSQKELPSGHSSPYHYLINMQSP